MRSGIGRGENGRKLKMKRREGEKVEWKGEDEMEEGREDMKGEVWEVECGSFEGDVQGGSLKVEGEVKGTVWK